MMHSLFALSAAAVAVLSAELDITQSLKQWSDEIIPHYAPDVTVVEENEVFHHNKAYVVKMECLGCPFAVKKADFQVEWQEPPQENALRLHFTVDTYHHEQSSLMLNGRRILPIETPPPYINAYQVPSNISTAEMSDPFFGPRTTSVQMPLKYVHTVLRTQENGKMWVQFDVTGLPLHESNDPSAPYLDGDTIEMDKEGQKLVQILLRNETDNLTIEDVQVVARKDRAQPYRMKCGRLAMVQTTYDPTEWDEYGKVGTESRLWNLVASKISEVWEEYLQHDTVLIPVVFVLAFAIVMLRRWYVQRQQEKTPAQDDAEIALLTSEYEDAPPVYADTPVIKIEEYD
ncbi:hypothetical protein EK21DRAFT_72244 [Setomelanomma holmii]|uniref:DUF7728 domain-containing protein n=1 Tax=Setomelanomma holmii TaxID=210430 RepID=A0A9P4H4Y8_9PLEO|nr:hypothetical protein EK21DRAFT_72244 [Setomelanomma holmii]